MGTDFQGKTYWIVGGTQGLGRALSLHMAGQGAKLIISGRSEATLAALQQDIPDFQALPMDVTDQDSVAKAATLVGRLDGLIYCAGYYSPMKAQDWDVSEVEAMVQVNYLGAQRVVGAVLPAMLEQGQGHLALIGSLSGFKGLPGAIGYSDSKAAMMNFAEALYADLWKTPIRVQLISPGFIRTRLTDKNRFNMPQIMTAEQAADHVMRAMTGRRFHTVFPRPFAWVFKWGRLLPDRWFYRFLG